MSEKNVVSQEPTGTDPRAATREVTIRPRVDVYEDAEGITLFADLPGVSSEGLSVQVDKDTLTIDGAAKIDMPEGIQPLYAEVRNPQFQRSFSLSTELDTGAIRAQLRDGVLELHIPKRAEVRPRRIDVKVA